ncbi:MAG: methanogenesis marker 9 domain-containing protein [Methanocalculaceae archaeon]|jgi:TIM-barrel protein|nr:methanogenesis marker 9 domain-containing protein [Methanocalculaceae archaeon]
MRGSNRFLSINGKLVKTPIALASMAGITNAGYAIERAAHVGTVFIGGFSLDASTQEASRKMIETGRTEFSGDFDQIATELAMLEEIDVVVGLNLRGSTPEAYVSASHQFGNDVIYEIDAHCHQQPMIDAHCGEYLLHNVDALCAIVRALHAEGVCVSVKIRAGVVDDRLLARKLWAAGADILHIDLMDSGYTRIRQIRNSCPLIIIANNNINAPNKMMDMFSHGADMVSLARSANVATLQLLDRYIRTISDESGWYNAPKQLCRGGDLRSLAFCCMPVKQCPLLPTLDTIGMNRQEYLSLKRELTNGTEISKGSHTCFGSLAWCCKPSTPCMFRDTMLESLSLTKSEYMIMKRKLSDGIMEKIFVDASTDC